MALAIPTKSSLKDPMANTATKKSLRWAADVVDNVPKKAKIIHVEKGESINNNSNNIQPDKTSKDKPPGKTRLCGFCGQNPACVRMKASWRGKDKKQALCLLHYYTTAGVHAGSEHLVILDPELLDAQEKGTDSIHHNNKKNKLHVQDLFAEVFVELQADLAKESLNISVAPEGTAKKKAPPKRPSIKDDPLAILHDLGRSHKKRKAPPVATSETKSKAQGGFLKPIPVPERLKKTQEQQARWQAEQEARMNRVAKNNRKTSTNSKAASQAWPRRRDQSRKRSIWSNVMEYSDKKLQSTKKKIQPRRASQNKAYHEIDLTADDVTCSCGSTNVVDVGNVTSRNADVRKGEIWGSGDHDDVVLRYRCNQCGKTWQESG